MLEEKYSNSMQVTSQFPMCGNCFRVDTYKGCYFGCNYCFANARKAGGYTIKHQIADIKLMEKWFEGALNKGETNNINKELLNRRTPIHLGGMSDPFQVAEWKYGVTKEFLKLSNRFNYPVNISTKTAHLPDEYWELLNPEIHTFSISIIGYTDEYIRKFETHTPTAKQRIRFIKKLHEKGFWVSIRIQPIIDIEEVLLLIKHSEKYVDYYTIEHLKLPVDNSVVFKELTPLVRKYRMNLMAAGREFEFDNKIKIQNIKRIKAATKVKIGCGDNDFHDLSDSLNCCGVDLMPPAFSNWLKYNSMYIRMTGDKTQFYPKKNCSGSFMSKMVVKGFNYKDYTDAYYLQRYGNNPDSLFDDKEIKM